VQEINFALLADFALPDPSRRDTVREAQKQQLKQPQTPILFWPSNILAMAVKS